MDDQYQYAVVLFTEEDDAPGVVSTDWLSCNENVTYYPKVTTNLARDKLLSKRASPDYNNWRQYQVKVLKKYNTLLEAQQALSLAEETSCLSEDEEEARRNRGQRKKKKFCFEEEQKEDRSTTPPSKKTYSQGFVSPCPTLTYKATQRPYPSPHSINKPGEIFSSSPSSSNQTCSRELQLPSPAQNKNHKTSECDNIAVKQMQHQILELVESQKRIERKLDLLLAKISGNPQGEEREGYTKPESFEELPLGNVDDFYKFETSLKDENRARQLVRFFHALGGKDLKTTVNTILRRAMADELASSFSYSGKSTPEMQKVAFSKQTICKCVQVAARKSYAEATEATLKTLISNWLQQAKFRMSRKKKEVLDLQNVLPEEDLE